MFRSGFVMQVWHLATVDRVQYTQAVFLNGRLVDDVLALVRDYVARATRACHRPRHVTH